MPQLNTKLNALKQRTELWLQSTSLKIQKWHFQAKKDLIGVSFSEDIRHKFKCAKQELYQQKREIDLNFNDFALKFADKITEKLNNKPTDSEKLKAWINTYNRYDEQLKNSTSNLSQKMTSWIKKNK